MTYRTKTLIFLLLGTLLFSCSSSSESKQKSGSERKPQQSSSDDNSHLRNPDAPKKETVVIVKDKNDYSATFLSDLRKSMFKKIELLDSLLIIESRDTIQFASEPVFGESVLYTGKKDNLVIALTLTRKNYTTVSYKLEMVEFGKASFNKTGEADVSSSFYLGSESDEDAQTGELYFVAEYSSHDADNCDIHIRVSDEKKRCKLIKTCNGKIRDINLNTFPALVEKNRFENR